MYQDSLAPTTLRRTVHAADRPTEAGSYLPPEAYLEYERLHKHFVGPARVNQLMRIYTELAQYGESSEYLSTAGWAAAEAALVATDRPEDERFMMLEGARETWKLAIERRRQRNDELGRLEGSDDDPTLLRLELDSIFLPLLESMITGDLTREVRAKVYDDLLMLAARNSIGLVEASQRDEDIGLYVGLGHEINAILAVNRLQSPTLIAMPSIGRADNGRYYPEQTHDVELLHLEWGNVKKVTTLELKSRPRDYHYKRYKSAIVAGRIHLYTHLGQSPIDTVLLFLKEEKDELTAEERSELERMTDVIVHLARHQLSDDPDVPLHCRNIETCDKVPHRRSLSILRRFGRMVLPQR